MGNSRLRQFSIPMDQNTDYVRQTAWHRDLTRTQHGYESPTHFSGTLRGKRGSKIICDSEYDTGNIFGFHFKVRLQDCLEQFTRGLQNKIGLVCSDCCCTANSTDWHGLLL